MYLKPAKIKGISNRELKAPATVSASTAPGLVGISNRELKAALEEWYTIVVYESISNRELKDTSRLDAPAACNGGHLK